jgi:hypothetical protein
LKECGGNPRWLNNTDTALAAHLDLKEQCSSYFAGKNRRTSTKEESLSKAKEIAEDWYLQLRGKLRSGENQNRKNLPRSIGTIPS